MNALSIGLNRRPLLDFIPKRDFLLIDDGEVIDAIKRRSRSFDPGKHSFNPLLKADHKRVREIARVLYAAEPGGETTLTVRNGKRMLAKMLLEADCLDELTGDPKDPAVLEALGVVDAALFSPVVRNVLCSPPNFALTGTIMARLNRAEHGEDECFIIGNLLAALYQKTVIFTDYGSYAHKGHSALIRQNRLVAGINSFDEVPELRDLLLLIEQKAPSRTTPKDAELLALYAGIPPHTNGYNDYIQECIQPA